MVAGAAVAHHRSDQQMEQAQQQAAVDQQAAYQQGQADAQAASQQAQAAPAPADPMDAKMAALKQLGELHDSGILTDEEFAAQKQKILDS